MGKVEKVVKEEKLERFSAEWVAAVKAKKIKAGTKEGLTAKLGELKDLTLVDFCKKHDYSDASRIARRLNKRLVIVSRDMARILTKRIKEFSATKAEAK